MTEGELGRLLTVARLRPLAEFGRVTVRREQGEVKRQRDTWKRKPLTFDELGSAVERARERLRDNPALVAELEYRGRERALTYKMALLTGLRKGELASLTVANLDLDSEPAFVTLNAADEKNREGNSLPLRSDLAAELRAWLTNKAGAFQDAASDAPTVLFDPRAVNPSKSVTGDSGGRNGQSCQDWTALPPETPVFHVPTQLIRILDRDLAAAGIPKRDERGRTLDVHAMRTTFGTLLSAAGVFPRTAQAAMRHSDIGLTMNTYTDPKLLDVAGAVESLPALPLASDPGRDRLAATGTEPAVSGFGPLAPTLAPTTDKSDTRVSNPVKMAILGTDPKKDENPRFSQGNQGFFVVPASRGGEIRTRDLLHPKRFRVRLPNRENSVKRR
jgi:integrase